MTRKKITCIGNTCTDIVARTDDHFLEKYGMRKSYCSVIDNLEILELIKFDLDHYELIPGGAAANTAHVLSTLGDNVNFISLCANDTEGMHFKKNLEENGVKSDIFILENREILSTQVLSFITPDGDRTFASYYGAAQNFCSRHISHDSLEHTILLYMDGYAFCSPQTASAYLESMAKVHAQKGLTCLNVGDRSIIETKRQDVISVLESCDGFICNKAEASALYGDDESFEFLAKTMLDEFQFGAITDGENGAYIFRNGEIIYQPADDISNIKDIDSIGAGDHFAAAILHGITHEFELETIGRLANLCAVDCLSHIGGRPLGGKGSLMHLVEQSKT